MFESSVRNNAEPVLFNDKKYTFIVDSTSSQGSFSSGQIQFNLKTLSSQSQWQSLREMVVEFPIKITAQVTTAAVIAGSPTIANGTFAGIDAAIIKSGFHQWINSAQLIINGQTIQSTQQYENVATTYRILSSWSQDTLKKWGSSTGVALDDMTGDSTASTASVDTVGLNSAAFGNVAEGIRGFDAVNNQNSLSNRGIIARAKLNNAPITTTSVAGAILGTSQMISSGMSNVSTFSSAASVTAASQYIFVQYMMGTVRVRDLFDIDEFPLVKNLDGYMYLNVNGATTILTGASANTVSTNALSAASTTMNFGLTCPYLLNVSSVGVAGAQTATNGINFDAATGATGTPTKCVVTVVGAVDGTKTTVANMTTGGTAGGPLLTQARLIAPYYAANPQVDAALTMNSHKFSTLEKIVNPITVVAGGSTNYTITVGVPNPRKLVLLPMWTNLGGASLASPEISCFDTVPATSGPFAYLSQLQVYVANKPLFQYPINYDFEMWNSQISSLGANGNIVDELTSGLLTQQLWSQNHRFYTIDLQRRMESEDGSSKSVQVSFTNPSPTTGYGLKVIAIVFYEKHWTIDTSLCNLSSYA